VLGQDFFEAGVIPADTDFRMLSYRELGALPGVDVATLLDGHVYHTLRDEVENIRPGTLQSLGDNALAAALEFARVLGAAAPPPPPDAAAPTGGVFFDVLGRFMVIYSARAAALLHHAPLAALLAASLAAGGAARGAARCPPPPPLLRGAAAAAAGFALALIGPAALGGARALLSGAPLAWYARPRLAFAMHAPAAVAGLLLPHCVGRPSALAPLVAARRALLGAAALYGAAATGLTTAGFASGFLPFLWAAAATAGGLAAPAGAHKRAPWAAAAALAAPLAAAALVTQSTAYILAFHVIEKIGLSGGAASALSRAAPDAAVGAIVGFAAALALGAAPPLLAAGLGRRRARTVVAALLAFSLAAAAATSRGAAATAPYSYARPKRVLAQHLHRHGANGAVAESRFSFAAMDPVPVEVALPPAVRRLPRADFAARDWVALHPLDSLVAGAAFVAPGPPPGARAPRLRAVRAPERWAAAAAAALAGRPRPAAEPPLARGARRVRLELNTARPAWAVLNLTAGAGGVTAWSLGAQVAAQRPGGAAAPPQHIVRYASGWATRRWAFWVDVAADAPLRVELFVKHLAPSAELAALLAGAPDWVSPAAFVAWQSAWEFAP
jgi:hypothetical protein